MRGVNKVKKFVTLLFLSSSVYAGSANLNPEEFPSIQLDAVKTQIAGMPKDGVGEYRTDGKTLGAKMDLRIPLSKSITWHGMAEAEGINNNLRYTDGYRLETGFRFYFRGKK
jgi:hypothetical protein